MPAEASVHQTQIDTRVAAARPLPSVLILVED